MVRDVVFLGMVLAAIVIMYALALRPQLLLKVKYMSSPAGE